MCLLTVLRFRPNSLAMALNESPLSLRPLTASQRLVIDRVARDCREADPVPQGTPARASASIRGNPSERG